MPPLISHESPCTLKPKSSPVSLPNYGGELHLRKPHLMQPAEHASLSLHTADTMTVIGDPQILFCIARVTKPIV